MQLNDVVIALGAAVLLFAGAAGSARAATSSLTPAPLTPASVTAPAHLLTDDKDEVRIGPANILIEPNAYIKVGDHVRFVLDLPAEAVLKKVKRISVK